MIVSSLALLFINIKFWQLVRQMQFSLISFRCELINALTNCDRWPIIDGNNRKSMNKLFLLFYSLLSFTHSLRMEMKYPNNRMNRKKKTKQNGLTKQKEMKHWYRITRRSINGCCQALSQMFDSVFLLCFCWFYLIKQLIENSTVTQQKASYRSKAMRR